MSEHRYKFLRLANDNDNQIISHIGNCRWTLGVWQSVPSVVMCQSGFHCSKRPYSAFSWTPGEILASVEVDGESIVHDDKEAWQHMRIIRAWKWRKQDSVAFAIFTSSAVLQHYEQDYPQDTRPRTAIEAARAWLEVPSKENEAAAYMASAETYAAAESATYATRMSEASAHAAAYAASAASYTEATYAAARVAAYAAAAAAYAARAAAAYAARPVSTAEAMEALFIEMMDHWMQERIAVLEEVRTSNHT